MSKPSSSAIRFAWFLSYKLANSLFLGLSLGAVFILYEPLSPDVFSAGGVGLALATLLLATQYQRLLNARWFFTISLLVEIVIALGVAAVLLFELNLSVALFIYLGYQFTFVFGSYLVRCETLLMSDDRQLAQLDVAKQTGYLVGMGLAWLFYQALEQFAFITDRKAQVLAMQWPLILLEIVIIGLLLRAFTPQRDQ